MIILYPTPCFNNVKFFIKKRLKNADKNNKIIKNYPNNLITTPMIAKTTPTTQNLMVTL